MPISLARKSNLRPLLAVVLVGVTLPVSACVYLPVTGNLQPAQLKKVHAGSTRDEVLSRIGPPNILGSERFYVYDLASLKGGFFVVSLWVLPGTDFQPIDAKHFRMLLEFDDGGQVRRIQTEGADRGFWGFTTPKVTAPDPCRLPADSLLLKGRFDSIAFSPDGDTLAVVEKSTMDRFHIRNFKTGKQTVLIGRRGFWANWGRGYIGRTRFSHDGRKVAAIADEVIRIWDVDTGTEALTFERHGTSTFWAPQTASALAFTSDDRMIASGDNRGVLKLWDAETGREFASVQAHEGPVVSLAFSPDGRILVSAGLDASVVFWNPATARELGRVTYSREWEEGPWYDPHPVWSGLLGYTRERGWSRLVAFSPDGDLIAVGTRTHVEVWRAPSRDELEQVMRTTGKCSDSAEQPGFEPEVIAAFLVPFSATVGYGEDNVSTLVFSPDGERLAVAAQSAIVWDLRAGRELWRYTHDGLSPDWVSSIAFDPSGQILGLTTYNGAYLIRMSRALASECGRPLTPAP